MIDLRETTLPAPTLDRVLTEEIAAATNTEPQLVQETYKQELDNLAGEAKIKQYLGVLAIRRVKMLLREH
jgi:hypothetical protein